MLKCFSVSVGDVFRYHPISLASQARLHPCPIARTMPSPSLHGRRFDFDSVRFDAKVLSHQWHNFVFSSVRGGMGVVDKGLKWIKQYSHFLANLTHNVLYGTQLDLWRQLAVMTSFLLLSFLCACHNYCITLHPVSPFSSSMQHFNQVWANPGKAGIQCKKVQRRKRKNKQTRKHTNIPKNQFKENSSQNVVMWFSG